MKISTLGLAAAAVAIAGCAAQSTTPSATDASSPLIPRSVIFGNPERAAGQISPDGKYVSFLAPRDGVMNIWVVERGQPLERARPLTHEKIRPVQGYGWSFNSQDIVYAQDKGGDENFLLYAVNAATGAERTLTDYKGVRVLIYGGSFKRPDEVLIGINDRDKSWHDPYLLNIRTGEKRKLLDNTGRFSRFIVDDDLNVRFVTRSTRDGGIEVLRWNDGKPEPFDTIGFEDAQTTLPRNITRDGKTLYWNESRGRNTAALMAIDLATGQKRVVAEDPRADVMGGITEPISGRMLAYGVNYLKNEWRALDASIQADIEYLNANLKGEWALQSQTQDGRVWLVAHDAVTSPARVVVYDRNAKTLSPLYVSRPKLAQAQLPSVCPVEIKSRDGLTLVSYLTLPVGTDADGDCRPDRALPMVVDVHGGPWGRDSYGYDATSVWLANRGYASLRVNFRASTGFGKQFLHKGNLEWGGKMHDDLLDAVDWAVRGRIARPDKVAIYGGSYGGYATLWAMTHSVDQFACGVAIVAPSNLETLLASIPPYWESMREQFYRRMGDPRTEAGKALLKERSPLYYADRIRKPLLIGQGANDPRVKMAEADQILAAMEARQIPVTYVLYPDEGHGFARAPNRTSFFAVSEAFLSACLGGRFEPVGADFKGSSIQVPKGAEFVPGLKDAIKPAG